jgi:hypothetical protein
MRVRYVTFGVAVFVVCYLLSTVTGWALSNLIIVRAADDSLWKATCNGSTCSPFSSFPGMFALQPTISWDEVLGEWVVVGVASDGSIWRCTFNESGNFNNDWTVLPGRADSPVGMSGNVNVTRRTRYFSIGSEAFVPGSDVAYFNTYGCGGANISAGAGALVASVNLPQGAVITNFKVIFNDTSANNMSVSLERQTLGACGYQSIGEIDSSGISGYGSKAVAVNHTVDNTLYGYHIYAYADVWDGNLKIKGVVITYTIPGSP